MIGRSVLRPIYFGKKKAAPRAAFAVSPGFLSRAVLLIDEDDFGFERFRLVVL